MTDSQHLDLSETARYIHADILDSFDEELEMEYDDARLDGLLADLGEEVPKGIDRRVYFRELLGLQGELVKLQDWVVSQKLKVVVLFEGRDAAGKGGAIKRITQRLNPRVCRVAALPPPASANALNGISSATCRTYQRRARWSFSTAVGTTGRASSGSWASAITTSTKSFSVLSLSLKRCSYARASSSSSTGSRSRMTSNIAAS